MATKRKQQERELRRLESKNGVVFQETGVTDVEGHAVVEVSMKDSKAAIGHIVWHRAMRQYAFQPSEPLYIGRVLCDIYDVMGRMMRVLMERQREKAREKRAAKLVDAALGAARK